jgi:hypothetical protein
MVINKYLMLSTHAHMLFDVLLSEVAHWIIACTGDVHTLFAL